MSEIKKENNSYKEQEKAALMSFLFTLPGFTGLVITIILTGSLVTLIDFLDTLCNLIRDGFLYLLSKKLQNNLKYEYNYGVARLETLSALCCDCIMVAGLLIVFASSIRELFGPSAPSGILFFALACKFGAVTTDSYMLYKHYKIRKTTNSGVAKVAFAGALKSTLFDAVILVAYCFMMAFRNVTASYYMSPILCIVIAIYLGRQCILRIIDYVGELIDKTLSEEMQMKIIRVLTRYYDEYEELNAINCHKIGEQLFIDLNITFKKDEEFANIAEFRQKLEKDLNEILGDCKLTIAIS